MKTQISNLINGMKDVRRKESDAKYINAPRASSHKGCAGTLKAERYAVADKVHMENPDGLIIEACGISLRLERRASGSGRTVRYCCVLSEADALSLLGWAEPHSTHYETRYELEVQDDMTVIVFAFSRKSSAATWKQRWAQYIDESYITIQ